MANFEIFEREIVGKDGSKKKINEVIDISKHTWTTMDGNIIMKHEAVLLLRKFTGAKFLKPELQTPISNPGNVVYLCSIEFPDGEISYEIGESNNDNTKGWSKGIKPTMAFKRGYDRAFLRSDYIGLFEVYSEEESESFKKPISTETAFIEQNFNQQELTNFTELVEESSNPIPNSYDNGNQFTTYPSEEIIMPDPSLFLPGTDSKYPGEHIIEDVLKKHRDFEYLDKIPQNYPNNEDYVKIVSLIQEKREEKMKQKQVEAESFLNSNISSHNPEKIMISHEIDSISVEAEEIFNLPPSYNVSEGSALETDIVTAEEFLNNSSDTPSTEETLTALETKDIEKPAPKNKKVVSNKKKNSDIPIESTTNPETSQNE